MRAELTEYANAAFAVAEDDEILAKQLCLHRRAVGHNLFGEAGRDPMSPHKLAHWRTTFDSAKQVILFRCHRVLLAASLMRRRSIS
jgi:hypothetical protein